MANVLIANYSSYRREPRARRFAEAAVKNGNRVIYIACREPGGPHRETVNGVEILAYSLRQEKPKTTLKYILEYFLFFFIILYHLTRKPLEYDLIHICNMPDLLVFGAILPRMLGIPVIHDVHDTMPDIYQHRFNVSSDNIAIRMLWYQLLFACRFASHVLVATPYQERQLVEKGIDGRKITVILNLPDETVFCKRKPLPEKNPETPFVVVYHGTLSYRLGLDIAIRAMNIVCQSIPKIEMRIIGDGEERSNLIRLRDELNITDRVWFSEGYVPLEQVTGYIEDADVAVIPLRDNKSTRVMLPTKLMEYALMGIPAVVTPSPLVREYFDSSMVVFAESENPERFAVCIKMLLADQRLRENIVVNCHDKFTRRFRWDSYKKMYLGLVSRLTNRKYI